MSMSPDAQLGAILVRWDGRDGQDAEDVDWLISQLTQWQLTVMRARELLLAEGGQFDDDHTHDAHRLAKVAELLGLRVVWETCDGCPGHLVPAGIKAGSDG